MMYRDLLLREVAAEAKADPKIEYHPHYFGGDKRFYLGKTKIDLSSIRILATGKKHAFLLFLDFLTTFKTKSTGSYLEQYCANITVDEAEDEEDNGEENQTENQTDDEIEQLMLRQVNYALVEMFEGDTLWLEEIKKPIVIT